MKISHFFKFSIFSFFIFLILQSCVSKKNILYVQDINAKDISKVFSAENLFQENDILKIDVTSLEMEASITIQ